jgi:hypothetical protein
MQAELAHLAQQVPIDARRGFVGAMKPGRRALGGEAAAPVSWTRAVFGGMSRFRWFFFGKNQKTFACRLSEALAKRIEVFALQKEGLLAS